MCLWDTQVEIPQGLRQELTLVRKKYSLWTGTDQMHNTNWNQQNWNEAGSHSPLGRGSSQARAVGAHISSILIIQ